MNSLMVYREIKWRASIIKTHIFYNHHDCSNNFCWTFEKYLCSNKTFYSNLIQMWWITNLITTWPQTSLFMNKMACDKRVKNILQYAIRSQRYMMLLLNILIMKNKQCFHTYTYTNMIVSCNKIFCLRTAIILFGC